MHQDSGAPSVPSDLVVAALEDAGHSLHRAEVARRIAPRLGHKRTRIALGLAVISGRVELDAHDFMHLVSEGPRWN